MKIIDGKLVSEAIKEKIKKETSLLIDNNINPHLVAILVGNDPASQTYVNAKRKACEETGIISTLYEFEETITEDKLLSTIDFLNKDSEIHGIIVQLPLPKHISSEKVIAAISPDKDVDGFHALSVGKMALGMPTFLPATPNGILELLKYYKIDTEGKHCVVLGRSHIVGMPMSIMMGQKSYPGNSTVTLCHSRTENLKEVILQADILIVAIGSANFVTDDMVKEGAVVIDVGMHRIPDKTKKSGFRLTGDVDFENVSKKCSYITPVPKGVGPMTIVSLLLNTVKAAKQQL